MTRGINNVIGLELRRYFGKLTVIWLLLLLIFSLLSVIKGINDYREVIQNETEFKKIEQINFKMMPTYVQYGYMGIELSLIPSINTLLFSNQIYQPRMSGEINAVVNLNIFDDRKGKSLFGNNSQYKFRFSSILIFLVSCFSLWTGFEATRHRDFLKFLINNGTLSITYLSILFSRFLFQTVSIIIIFFISVGIIRLSGVPLDKFNSSGSWAFLGAVLIMSLLFLISGSVFGLLKNEKSGKAMMVLFWFFMLFIIPGLINAIIETKADKIPSELTHHLVKCKTVDDFEKEAEKKYGKFDKNNMKQEQQIVEEYWNSQFPLIEKLDKEYKEGVENVIRYNNKLSLFSPITFLLLTDSEVSSQGYSQFLDFYDYLLKKRREFLRFYIDREYYHDPKEMVNFIRGGENLFHAQSRLPKGFAAGVAINLGYIVILFILSFILFKRSLYHIKQEEIETLGPIDLELDRGDLSTWTVEGDVFERFLYNLFSGRLHDLKKNGLKGEFLLNERDLFSKPFEESFFYLCKPGDIPVDLKVKNLLLYTASASGTGKAETQSLLDRPEIKPILNKTFGKLEKREKFDALLALPLATKKDVYLIPNVASMYPRDCWIKLKDRLDQLKEDSLVVNLVGSEMEVMSSIDGKNCYEDGGGWEYNIEALRLKALHAERRKIEKEPV